MSADQKPQNSTTHNSVASEVMGYAITMHGPLSEREKDIILSVARVAYRWTLREVIWELEAKVKAS